MTQARFREIDAAHPEIWAQFDDFAAEMIRAGVPHYSADAILHRVRWETTLRSGTAPKINNDLAAYYARKWRAENPDRADFFRTRVSRADRPRAPQAAQASA